MRPRKLGSFDHLNNDHPLNTSISMEELAKKLESTDHGTHRLLSALVRMRRKNHASENNPNRKMLTDGIEKLLNHGLY